MHERHSVTLILPAYNEVARISGTIGRATKYFRERGYRYELIVAADGTDGTREAALDTGRHDSAIKVIGSAERRGKGHGIREAVMLARGNFIGFADADEKTPVEEFEKFIPLLSQGKEVVIGTRADSESVIEKPQPMYRRWGSKGFNSFMHAIVGLRQIKDTQCGFKFFQREVALKLFHLQKIDGYLFDVEVLYLAQKFGYHIAQVPVRWKDDADSRLQLFRGNVRNAIDLLRIPLIHRNLEPDPGTDKKCMSGTAL